MFRARSRIIILAAAAAAAMTMAGCESAPPPAPVEAPPPPAPPPPPPVAVAPRVVELAAAFEAYMERAANVTPAFADGAAVERSLTVAAAYEPRQLASGAVAYAAVAALQDVAFVESVRRYARSPVQRAEIAANIVRDPAYVVGIPNSAGAAGLAYSALSNHGTRVRIAGEQVKQAAYSVQKQAWSKATIPNREARLANVKALATALAPAERPAIERLRAMALGQQPSSLSGASQQPPYTPVVIRGMAIAALSALGYAEDPAWAESIQTMMNEPTHSGGASYCLNLSKMNLNQCLAVSKPWYEDVFCLGQHVMIDTGQCIVQAAGSAPAAVVPASTTPSSAATPTTPVAAVASSGTTAAR
jgi:hypothetical protein